MARSEESRARRTQTPPERRGLEEDPARAEAWAGSIGLRDRTVDGVAGGALDRGGIAGPLPYLAGLAHSAATGLELPASGRTGSGAVSAMPMLRQLPEISAGSALSLFVVLRRNGRRIGFSRSAVLVVVGVLACGKHGYSDVFGVRGSEAGVGVAAYFGIREQRFVSLFVH
jgi:hypothetical protein